MDPADQKAIDDKMVQELDGTKNEWGWCKSKLGANTILAVSMAVCKAGAASKKTALYKHIAVLAGNPTDSMFLPVPAFNIINGGSHAGNKLAMQEFMILPVGAASFTEAMKMGSEVYHNLKSVIKKKYGQDATNVGDEGGFAPNILANNEALDLVVEAIGAAGYTGKVGIAMDIAAAEFWNGETKKYDLDFKSEAGDANDKNRYRSSLELGDLYREFISKYPIVSIEDPFDQDDWEGYNAFNASVGENTQVVGDDLLVTNPERIKTALEQKSCN